MVLALTEVNENVFLLIKVRQRLNLANEILLELPLTVVILSVIYQLKCVCRLRGKCDLIERNISEIFFDSEL